MEKKDWFKVKRYPHIGIPLTSSDRNWVEGYVKNKEKVSLHAFYPFIHRTMKVRRFRKSYDEDSDQLIDHGKRKKSSKKREIFYANHLDSNIFSYYSSLISDQYEKKLIELDLGDIPTAYRRIYHQYKKRGKNNVDFAEDIFSYIRKSKKNNVVAMTFDITSFFDNLNHKKIKESWKSVLDCKSLPDDHYNVYKNITSFSFIEYQKLFEEFSNELLKRNANGTLKKIKVDKAKYLRNQDVIAFCQKKDFHSRVRKKNLIKNNKHIQDENEKRIKRNKGIPQGSPISSILANLYLIEFDKIMNTEVKKIDGLYRRYSDDIIILCDENSKKKINELVLNEIKNYDLEIQKKKTNSFIFKKSNNRFYCYKYLNNGELSKKRRFEYLGFEFDGKYSYIRSSSISKFYRNLKKAVRTGSFYAKSTANKSGRGQIFKRRLYKRFSYLGAKRKMIWKKNEKNGKWYRENRHDWGNYLTYTNMASFNMKNSKAKNQVKNHWEILNNLIKKEEIDIKKNEI